MIPNSSFRYIDKQTFAKFKKVRDITTPVFGTYSLKAKENVKYLVKCLPFDKEFHSYRSKQTSLYRYTQTYNTFYVYPLLGESLFETIKYFNPLSEVKNKISSKQFQTWYQKNNQSLQTCLKDILNVLIKAIQDGVQEILLQCLRVYNGQVIYCYETWMASSFDIIQNSPTQIQNYYLSAQDLQQIQGNKEIQDHLGVRNQNSMNSLFFRAFLLVLTIGSHTLKIRNYQYGKFSLNQQNLKRRTDYFKMNYNSKKLADLVQKIISGQQILIGQLCKFTNQSPTNLLTSMNTNSRQALTEFSHCNKLNSQQKKLHQSNSIQSLNMNQTFNSRVSLETKPSISKISVKTKQNKQNAMNSTILQNFGKQCLVNTNYKQPKSTNCKAQVRVKLKQNNKKYNLSTNQQTVVCQTSFNLKSEFSRQEQPSFCGNIKILKYLGLQEYLPTCSYQKNILQYLENTYIRDNFVKINHPNGSLYFGQVNLKNERHGTGLYMFSSDDIYFGEWKNNQMSGQGRYIFRSGQVYVGTLKNGIKNGYGKFIYADGKIYEGYWDKNQKCGLSIMTFPNKVKFFGQFESNQSRVEGVFIGQDQNQKVIWKQNGLLNSYDHEKNKFKYKHQDDKSGSKKLLKISTSNFVKKQDSEGNNFVGSMKNNIKNGFGIQQSQKHIYKGTFINNQRDGVGQLTGKQQGFTIKGQWKQGMLVHYQLSI